MTQSQDAFLAELGQSVPHCWLAGCQPPAPGNQGSQTEPVSSGFLSLGVKKLRSRTGVGQAQARGAVPSSEPSFLPHRLGGRLLSSGCLQICLGPRLCRESGCCPRGGTAWNTARSPGCSLQKVSIKHVGWGYERWVTSLNLDLLRFKANAGLNGVYCICDSQRKHLNRTSVHE